MYNGKTYGCAYAYLAAGRTTALRRRRPIADNTWLERIDDSHIGVKFHESFVVIYARGGGLVLNSYGWRTVTTKLRMNTYSPAHVFTRNNNWYVQLWEAGGWYVRPDASPGVGWLQRADVGPDGVIDFVDGMTWSSSFRGVLARSHVDDVHEWQDDVLCGLEQCGMSYEDHAGGVHNEVLQRNLRGNRTEGAMS